MQTAVVEVTNRLGLHARPAKTFVKEAQKFCSEITLVKTENSARANAKSIFSVMALGAGKGTRLELQAEGADEFEAISVLETLFAQNLLEAE